MNTKLENGARTPETIYNELKKYGKYEGSSIAKNSDIYYEYFTTPQFGKDTPAIEVTLAENGKRVISTRKIDKSALPYLINDPVLDIAGSTIASPANKDKPNDNFIFGGF